MNKSTRYGDSPITAVVISQKNDGIMKTMTEESLQRKLARLESALDTERARLRKACDKIPWGAGMRRTKMYPVIPKRE